MLRSMQLENFKAFGQRTIIPLAPITLIFGENSSGKSSILQSLNLLKQTRESRDVEALLLPRTDNGFVDLGSFQEMLFDHELERQLHIRLDTSWENEFERRRFSGRAIPQSNGIGLEVSFARKSLKDEVSLHQVQLYDPSNVSRGASKTATDGRFKTSRGSFVQSLFLCGGHIGGRWFAFGPLGAALGLFANWFYVIACLFFGGGRLSRRSSLVP